MVGYEISYLFIFITLYLCPPFKPKHFGVVVPKVGGESQMGARTCCSGV